MLRTSLVGLILMAVLPSACVKSSAEAPPEEILESEESDPADAEALPEEESAEIDEAESDPDLEAITSDRENEEALAAAQDSAQIIEDDTASEAPEAILDATSESEATDPQLAEEMAPATTEPVVEEAPGSATAALGDESKSSFVETSLPVEDVSPATAAAPAPAAGEYRVWYVQAASLEMRAEPSSSARVIRTLSTGDNVLIQVDGEWARLKDGGFVQVSGLTMNAQGRNEPPAIWK